MPSSSEGAACTCGGAVWAGGDSGKENSCTGDAAAEADNATTPMASAPKAAAARREFNLIASRLNIGRPLCKSVLSAFAPFPARSQFGTIGEPGFRTFAPTAQNGFVALRFVSFPFRPCLGRRDPAAHFWIAKPHGFDAVMQKS